MESVEERRKQDFPKKWIGNKVLRVHTVSIATNNPVQKRPTRKKFTCLSILKMVLPLKTECLSYNHFVQRIFKLSNPLRYTAVTVALAFGGIVATSVTALALPLGNNGVAQLISRGRSEYAQSAYTQAAATFQKAVDAKPDSWEAHLELGKAMSRMGNADGAILQLFESLKLNIKNPQAREELAVVFMNRASWDEAGGQLKQVIDMEPDNYLARGNYGLWLRANRIYRCCY